jgi:hypothetical protein
MRRRYVFIDGGAPTGGGGGGTLQQTVQMNIGDGTWNTPTVSGWFRFCSDDSSPISSITNTAGSNTGWALSRGSAVNGFSEGPTSSTTAGYPADVTRYGNAQSSTVTFTFNNLNNSYTYTFDFFGSTLRLWENSAGTTNWTIGGTTVSILHKDYYGDKVTISSVSPSSGNIAIDVSKNASAANWYWNAVVIKEYN